MQSDAAPAIWYRGQTRLHTALRIEAHFGKVAARLTRKALDRPFYSCTLCWKISACSRNSRATKNLRNGFAIV